MPLEACLGWAGLSPPVVVLPGPRSCQSFAETLVSLTLVVPDAVNPFHGCVSFLPSWWSEH